MEPDAIVLDLGWIFLKYLEKIGVNVVSDGKFIVYPFSESSKYIVNFKTTYFTYPFQILFQHFFDLMPR
ncbi:hypothetical protein IEQ34_010362 [Dendrobium chrysotoxum]|uniref:Uncharacterized protein n=1 Tax=Dendrobium chrysotoxum TaxID=161865 RepID=A0AAV7H3C8_DENCH|nr:hypothetical protein IEQ34_010362 [Dendrobium chrysotoxum]